jgi:hypothetical protein
MLERNKRRIVFIIVVKYNRKMFLENRAYPDMLACYLLLIDNINITAKNK